MSVAATAGAAAWVVPEILTAKPAAGATLSGNHGGGGGGGGGGSTPATSSSTTTGGAGSTPGGSTSPATSSVTSPSTPSTLAFTGIDIQRDAEIGAALVAGGWAMHHWSSRTARPAAATVAEAHEAGSPVDPT